MTQYIRWGVAAALSAAIFAGCGGGSDKSPASPATPEGQGGVRTLPPQTLAAHPETALAQMEHTTAAGEERYKFPGDPTGLRQGAPFSGEADIPQLTGTVARSGPGRTTGALGAFRVQIDENLQPTVVMDRTGEAQGDRYLLGVHPFFQPGDVQPTSVRLTNQGTLELTMNFKHPFAAPADIIGPASASKRLDLHVFNVWAGVIVSGTENFFTGTVTTNTEALVNADSYREIGGLASEDDGVAPTNVFPGKWVADQSPDNTDESLDNYDEADNGWETNELLAPRGYGVFPQGGQASATFELDPGAAAGPINVDFVILADYMDPRGGATPPEKRANRLPNPLDPLALRYFLPYGAGDLQSIDVTAGSLGGAAGSTRLVTLRITDFDADKPVAGAWPNNANLHEMPFSSDIASVATDFPTGIGVTPAAEGAGSGDGSPGSPKLWEFTLSNDGPVAEGSYVGMVQVVDEENANRLSEQYFQLDPALLPIANDPIEIRAFQAIPFNVGAAGGTDIIVHEVDSRLLLIPFGVAPGGVQDPLVDLAATSIAVDQERGSLVIGMHGIDFILEDGRWGNGLMTWEYDSPWFTDCTTPPCDVISSIGFLNNTGDTTEPRPYLNKVWVNGSAFHDADARSDCASGECGDTLPDFGDGNPGSIWAMYDANATAQGYMGWTEGHHPTFDVGPFTAANLGRPFSVFLNDMDLWYNDQPGWFDQRGGGNVLLYNMDRYDTTGAGNGNPVRAHTPGVDQGLLVDVAIMDFDRVPGARFGNRHEMQCLVGQYGTASAGLADDTEEYMLMTIYDIDDDLTTLHEENWADFDVSPQIHTGPEFLDGQGHGDGIDAIDELDTVGMDFHPSDNRLYVADEGDDDVEIFQSVPTPDLNDGISFGTFTTATAPGDLVDPIDICVVENAFVVVLDRGGAGDGFRLVVLDPDDLSVLGTRDLVPTGDFSDGTDFFDDISTGPIGIASDKSQVILDNQSTFVLLWDDPAGSDPDIGGVGGINYYTIDLP